MTPFESDGNFILIDVSRTGRTSTEIVDFAKREGLLATAGRHCPRSGQRTRARDHRYAREENDMFLTIFARAISVGVPDAQT